MAISSYVQWLETGSCSTWTLPYLDKWEKSVEYWQDFSDTEKKLSAETCLGLWMTGTVPALLISHYCSFFVYSEFLSGHFCII